MLQVGWIAGSTPRHRSPTRLCDGSSRGVRAAVASGDDKLALEPGGKSAGLVLPGAETCLREPGRIEAIGNRGYLCGERRRIEPSTKRNHLLGKPGVPDEG
jgi:hypothetical protein